MASPTTKTPSIHGNRRQGTKTKNSPPETTHPKNWKTPLFPWIPLHPGGQASNPRETSFRRPPLAEFGAGARSFAGDTEGRCVGEPWRGPGRPNDARESRFPAERTEPEYL